MIVRIATEGQYEVDDALAERLNELDNRCVELVDAGDEQGFRSSYEELLALVREQGREVADDDLVASELILPPPDLGFDEAAEQFSGEGLIPD